MVREEEELVNSANVKVAANKSISISTDKSSNDVSDPGEPVYTPPDSIASLPSLANSNALPTSLGVTPSTAPMPPQAVHEGGDANISIREYIYFMPYPLPPGTPIPYTTGLPDHNPLHLPPTPFEPTSTLVLTSPNRTFIDIRFFKPMRPGEETPLPNKGERERLEWCFAGHSESHPIDRHSSSHNNDEPEQEKGEQWQGLTHSKWTHWLDSRFPVGSPNIPIDEGDMYPLASNLTLEHGHAFQPLLGAVKTHEEMWRDETALSINTIGSKICVVLRCHADAAGVRGVVVRVGQFCQGIVIKGDHVTAERWEFEFNSHIADADRKADLGTWKRTARVGDLFLPCAVTFRPEILACGGVVRYWDYEWVVEEVWEWM